MRIISLVLQTKDPEGLAFFYSHILNMSVEKSEGQFTILLENGSIQFQQDKTVDAFYHFAITIPCNKIVEALEWLKDKTELLWIEDYNSFIADFVHWNARSLYFMDSAGNIVELIARMDLANGTEEPFSARHFLSVSEIGLVFPSEKIEEETSRLLQDYPLQYFSRQSPFPNFKAVGTDEGLFIIVTAHRNWYPTRKASLIFPVEVEFEVSGQYYKRRF